MAFLFRKYIAKVECECREKQGRISRATYDAIHASSAWLAAPERVQPVMGQIVEQEVYDGSTLIARRAGSPGSSSWMDPRTPSMTPSCPLEARTKTSRI